jgi:transposase InsO family protein
VPIRSKTANEMSRRLWEFICLFGPPKEMISDQGKEWLNSIISELVKLVGIDHRITSAYHPRTNGLTERFNQTFCSALRKQAEDTPEEYKNKTLNNSI